MGPVAQWESVRLKTGRSGVRIPAGPKNLKDGSRILPLMGVLERVKKMVQLYKGMKPPKEEPIKALILISMRLGKKERKRETDIAKELSKIDFVKKAWVVAGEWDIILYVETEMSLISDFVLRKLRNIKEIEKTKTIFIFEEFK